MWLLITDVAKSITDFMGGMRVMSALAAEWSTVPARWCCRR